MLDAKEAVNGRWSKFAKTKWGQIKSKETEGEGSETRLDADDTAQITEWRMRGPAREPARRIQPPGPKKRRPSRKEPPAPQQNATVKPTPPANASPEPKNNVFSTIAKLFTRK